MRIDAVAEQSMFPAHAGMNRGRPPRGHQDAHASRIRGDEPDALRDAAIGEECFPRMREKLIFG